jgi:hypothetical protein
MSVTNTWVVEQMDCYPQAEGEIDVVFTVHWRVTYVAGSPFTPYADLTQAQVIGWVQDAMGPEQVDNIESGLATNIANQANPPVVTPPLPWAA